MYSIRAYQIEGGKDAPWFAYVVKNGIDIACFMGTESYTTWLSNQYITNSLRRFNEAIDQRNQRQIDC